MSAPSSTQPSQPGSRVTSAKSRPNTATTLIASLEKRLRQMTLELKYMNREEEPNEEVLRDKKDEIANLMIRYTEVTQGKTYTESHHDRCHDFIDDFYYAIDKPSRDAELLEPFFDEQCRLSVIGVGNVAGKEQAVKALLVSGVNIAQVSHKKSFLRFGFVS